MFHFRRLELVHWDYWQRVTLPLDGRIVTVVGPNGSGKTTLLDALRTLLATKCSAKREYKRYVRRNGAAFAWLRAVVDNRRAGGRHPHPFWPLMDDEVTLACRIRKQGGDWLRQYAIEAGDVPVETLEATATWLGVEDYRRRLDSAGLSKAIIEVLALEQGDTDKLCEYSPRQLLDLVFHVFGDKEVLDAYLQAKFEQKEAERELRDMEGNLATLEKRVEAAIDRANRYTYWRGLKDEHVKLSAEVLPRLEIAELRESIAGAANHIAGLRHQQTELEDKKTKAGQHLADIRARLASSAAEKAQLDTAYGDVQTRFQAARDAVLKTEGLLTECERLVALAKAREGAESAQAAEQIGRDRNEMERARSSRERCEARLKEITPLVAALQSGQMVPPEFVRAYCAALSEAGIAHHLLSDIVEVTDPAWQGAVEALLQAYRHVVLLADESDRETAWHLGEQLKYRHFVVAGRKPAPKPQPGSVLAVVKFTQDAPEWLAQHLNRVRLVKDAAEGATLPRDQDWVTRAGYHRERRGGRFIGVSAAEFHFGAVARREQLAALRIEAKELEQKRAALDTRMNQLQRAISEAQALVMGVDAAQMLAARSEEFAAAETRLPELTNVAQETGAALAAAQTARDQAIAASSTLVAEEREAMRHTDQVHGELTRIAPELSRLEQEQLRRSQLLQHESAKMPAHWLEPASLDALRAQYGSPAAIRPRIDELERRSKSEEWETDPVVLEVRDKLKADKSALEAEVGVRRSHYERAGSLAHDARGAYINVLRATVKRYSKNLRSLGDLAGIEVHTDPPELANDDVTLAQAALNVRFNFDKKGLMGLNDGEASGGQQVMKSLILLIGLMMDEERPGGFVFIDEPFAHLDIFNIDRVGAFLRATHAQYLITTPNTHNINVFSPAELTLVTTKKEPQQTWARPVMVSRRKLPPPGHG